MCLYRKSQIVHMYVRDLDVLLGMFQVLNFECPFYGIIITEFVSRDSRGKLDA